MQLRSQSHARLVVESTGKSKVVITYENRSLEHAKPEYEIGGTNLLTTSLGVPIKIRSVLARAEDV